MQAVILIGMQASGKSTFYQQRFRDTHVRINLDMLRTRPRESAFIETCLQRRQAFVVDNTNPTRENRRRYIVPARECGFAVIGYWFPAGLEECAARNARRSDRAVIPLAGLQAYERRLEKPTLAEGFDRLYTVCIAADGQFVVEPAPGAVGCPLQ